MKIRFIIIVFLTFSSFYMFGQYYRPKSDKIQLVGNVGVGVGQENILSLPKLIGLVSFKLGSRTNSKHGKFQKNSFYLGSETSILVIFAGAFSISGTVGLKSGPFTADCSLTRLWLANPDGDVVARQSTFNPKIGIMIGPVWLKTGPSFLLTNENIFGESFGNFMHIGEVPFNLELNYNLTW